MEKLKRNKDCMKTLKGIEGIEFDCPCFAGTCPCICDDTERALRNYTKKDFLENNPITDDFRDACNNLVVSSNGFHTLEDLKTLDDLKLLTISLNIWKNLDK
tara:strand:+ start:1744 stop:2049 length:306 start_codon:yes stop_codon:yes gene_type:complete